MFCAYQGLTSYALRQPIHSYSRRCESILKSEPHTSHTWCACMGDPAGRRMISNRAFILFVRDNTVVIIHNPTQLIHISRNNEIVLALYNMLQLLQVLEYSS
jgi:hypothetical protein